jgi:hypothetical protein
MTLGDLPRNDPAEGGEQRARKEGFAQIQSLVESDQLERAAKLTLEFARNFSRAHMKDAILLCQGLQAVKKAWTKFGEEDPAARTKLAERILEVADQIRGEFPVGPAITSPRPSRRGNRHREAHSARAGQAPVSEGQPSLYHPVHRRPQRIRKEGHHV